MIKPALAYLACPYAHDDEVIRERRVAAATIVAGKLMQMGRVVYSPLTHCHPIHKLVSLPHTWEFWERIDRAFLEVSDELLVLMLPGWEKSAGVKAERVIANQLGLLTGFVDPRAFLDVGMLVGLE